MSAKPIARFCGAKVVNYFELSKRSAIFFDSANYRRALDRWRGISWGSALCVTVIIRRSYGDHSVIIR